MARRMVYQTKYHNRSSGYILLGALLVVAIVLFINCSTLNERKETLQAEEAERIELLEKEQQRALELDEYAKTTQTLKYYEQVARERLGMVYEDEIIFKKNE